MLIAYGFPKVYRSDFGKAEEWLYICQDLDYIVAVSETVAQVWSAGLHRVRLSEVVRSDEDIDKQGTNKSAYWCPNKSTLAVLVRESECSACCRFFAILVRQLPKSTPPSPIDLLERPAYLCDVHVGRDVAAGLSDPSAGRPSGGFVPTQHGGA